MTLITDTLMHSTNYLTTLFSHLIRLGSFFHFVPFTLCFGKRLFLFSKESLVGDLVAVTDHSKGIETHVNANSRASIWFLISFANIARDRRKPLTRRRACDSAGFRDTAKRSVLDNANATNTAQSQAPVVQPTSIGKLRIGDRIIAILTLISGKACFLACLCFLFETTEKCFECQIYSCRYLLQYLTIYLLELWMLFFQHWDCIGLVIFRVDIKYTLENFKIIG